MLAYVLAPGDGGEEEDQERHTTSLGGHFAVPVRWGHKWQPDALSHLLAATSTTNYTVQQDICNRWHRAMINRIGRLAPRIKRVFSMES